MKSKITNGQKKYLTLRETKQIISIIGEKNFLWLLKRFPGETLPGKRIENKIKKENFKKEFNPKAVYDIGYYVKKYKVSRATIYNWINS